MIIQKKQQNLFHLILKGSIVDILEKSLIGLKDTFKGYGGNESRSMGQCPRSFN